jgi:hypothetical protein
MSAAPGSSRPNVVAKMIARVLIGAHGLGGRSDRVDRAIERPPRTNRPEPGLVGGWNRMARGYIISEVDDRRYRESDPACAGRLGGRFRFEVRTDCAGATKPGSGTHTRVSPGDRVRPERQAPISSQSKIITQNGLARVNPGPPRAAVGFTRPSRRRRIKPHRDSIDSHEDNGRHKCDE